MGKKMLIDAAHPEETRVVVVQGNRIEEFDFESAAKKQLRGSIYLAKVTRVEPSLQAAFVDYGGNRHGFLAFSEIHPDYYQIPVADRLALLEEEAAEDRRFEEEQEARASGRRSNGRSKGDGDGKGDSGRRRSRRGRGRGRRRQSGEPQTSDLSVSVDTLDRPGTGTAFGESDSGHPFEDNQGTDLAIEQGADDSSGVGVDLSPPLLAPEAPDALTLPVTDEQDATQGDTDTPWQSGPDVEAPYVALAETSAVSRPLMADPMPSIAVRLEEPEKPARELESGAADDTEDRSQAEQVQTDPDAAASGSDAGVSAERHEDETADDAALAARDAATDTDEDENEDDDDAVSARGDDADEDDPSDEDDRDDEEDGAGADSSDDVETVGAEDAFEEVRPRRSRLRNYKIQEVIKRRQIMLVQVVKEERGNKGAALTTYLSLAGRYCVLMPNTARGGGISRKITQVNDRKRLKEVAGSLEVPEGMGLIVRTAGANRTKTEIKRDFEYLLRLWENVRDLTLRSSAPTLVYEEGNLVKRAIRDLYNKDIDAVHVEGEEGYKGAKAFMRMLMPSHARNVQPYRDRMPLFQRYQVEQQLDSMFSPQVELPSGGYLVINATEALVAIDVNSGRATKEHSIEDTALKTNVEAAEEVARQLRLRDLAGLIVIDFIDMEDYRNNRTVEKRLKECLKNDRARIQVGKISVFGLLEMSRQRLRAGVLEGSTQTCPHCEGTGKMRSVESASLRVLRACEEEGIRERCATATVRVPHTVALYILNQKRRPLMDLELRYGLTLMVEADPDLYSSEFQLERGEPLTEDRKAQIRDTAISMETAFNEPLDDMDEEDDEDVLAAEAEESQDDDEGEDNTAKADDTEARTSEDRPRRRRRRGGSQDAQDADGDAGVEASDDSGDEDNESDASASDDDQDGDRPRRRRRRGKRGGRRSRRSGDQADASGEANGSSDSDQDSATASGEGQPDTARETRNGKPSLPDADDPSDSETPAVAEADPGAASPPPDMNGHDPVPRRRGRSGTQSSPVEDRSAPDYPAQADTIDSPEPAEGDKKKGWWQRRFFSF